MRLWGTLSEALNSVTLQGISTYGTAQGFTGTAVPGMSAELGIADEFAIDQRWVLALDVVQDFAKGTHLHGTGIVAPVANVETSGFSLAPRDRIQCLQATGHHRGRAILDYRPQFLFDRDPAGRGEYVFLNTSVILGEAR